MQVRHRRAPLGDEFRATKKNKAATCSWTDMASLDQERAAFKPLTFPQSPSLKDSILLKQTYPHHSLGNIKA
ncbi:hypothetical protein O988_01637 [Pseudogymnoascus sp. VKM F-3808]|nr:hypothetical protein O988_01637 [Pseudogymnoascus sp. VKM F-3808]